MAVSELLWLGIMLGTIASMCGTIGKQLMRFSELQRRTGNRAVLYMAKVTLIVGLIFNTALGPIIDMVSYAFAPQSLIAPLGALDVVWNTASAPCTLGERLTWPLALGCFLVFAGAITTSLVGSHAEQEFTLQAVEEFFYRPAVAIYLVAFGIWLIFNVTVLMPRSKNPRGQPWETGDPLRGLSLGMTAGSIAGNMFCVKALVELVKASFKGQGHEIWTSFIPYAMVVGAIFFATSNLYFLTKAMREYEALFMGAVFEGSVITAACVSGCVIFKELEEMQAVNIFFYWFALVVMLLGIAVVSWEASRKAHEERRLKQEAEVEAHRAQLSGIVIEMELPDRRMQDGTGIGLPYVPAGAVVDADDVAAAALIAGFAPPPEDGDAPPSFYYAATATRSDCRANHQPSEAGADPTESTIAPSGLTTPYGPQTPASDIACPDPEAPVMQPPPFSKRGSTSNASSSGGSAGAGDSGGGTTPPPPFDADAAAAATAAAASLAAGLAASLAEEEDDEEPEHPAFGPSAAAAKSRSPKRSTGGGSSSLQNGSKSASKRGSVAGSKSPNRRASSKAAVAEGTEGSGAGGHGHSRKKSKGGTGAGAAAALPPLPPAAPVAAWPREEEASPQELHLPPPPVAPLQPAARPSSTFKDVLASGVFGKAVLDVEAV